MLDISPSDLLNGAGCRTAWDRDLGGGPLYRSPPRDVCAQISVGKCLLFLEARRETCSQSDLCPLSTPTDGGRPDHLDSSRIKRSRFIKCKIQITLLHLT